MLSAHDWITLSELVLGTIGAVATLFWFITKLLIDGLPKKLDAIYVRKETQKENERRFEAGDRRFESIEKRLDNAAAHSRVRGIHLVDPEAS